MANCDWLFKLSLDIGLSTLKKTDKREPLKSEKILRFIKDQGGIYGCLKYLEYLTFECQVDDAPIHTELGCLYVAYINNFLEKYQSSEGGKILDKTEADQDSQIVGNCLFWFNVKELKKKLSSFLEKSDLFAPEPMIEILPSEYLSD